jgi:uncharacterized protein with HEPN domain
VLECIERIEEYCGGGEAAFFASRLIQDGVLRNLQILAESTQKLSPDLKSAYPLVQWRQISGFRNVLANDYLGVNLERIWEIVPLDLPSLRTEMHLIRDRLLEVN